MKADELEKKFLRFNEYLNSIIQKPSIKQKFFQNIKVKKFINELNIKSLDDGFMEKFICEDFHEKRKEILKLYWRKFKEEYAKDRKLSPYDYFGYLGEHCNKDYFLDHYNNILKHIEEKFFNSKIKEQIKKEKKQI